MSKIKSVIESLLFLNGEPMKIADMAKGLNVSEKSINKDIDELIDEYQTQKRGLRIIRLEDCLQMCTSPENESEVMDFFKPIIKKDLSTSALETLSIVAYRQPITRVEIEDIRKVQCSYVLKYLQSHDLVKVVGKKNAVGHPSLYGTTDEFLRIVGIDSLEQLPRLTDDDIVTSI